MRVGWKTVSLSELVTLNYGKALQKDERNPDGKVPIYGANGIYDWTDRSLTKGPSLVIGRKGSAGEITRVDGPFWPSDVTYFTTHDSKRIDFDYLHYTLQVLNLPKLARGVKPGINRNDVYGLSVPLPPLEEQQRIVAILDEAFEGLSRARANAEANLQSARELFSSAIDRVFEPSTEWPAPEIAEIGEVFDGPHATPKTVDRGPIFLGISSLVDGRIDLGKTRHVTESDFLKWTRRVTPEAGDVVFSYETRLGQVGIIPEGIKCCLGRRMGLIRLNLDLIDPEYFALCYLSQRFQKFLRSKTIYGATVDRLSIKDFPHFPFPTPSREKQAEIVSQVNAIRSLQDQLLARVHLQLRDLAELRQSLLQKAYAGELTVKEFA